MAIKILILDDEKEILESLRRLLELDERFEVFTAEDPVKALEILTKENIQIVLCDIVMPRMDGLDFLQAAKSVNGLVQVVMMSAYSTVERVITALERGAADYIMKPIEPEELKQVLNDLVKRLMRWRDLVVKARGVQDVSENPDQREETKDYLRRVKELEEEEDILVRERMLFELKDYLRKHRDEQVVRAMLSSADPFVRNGLFEVGRCWGEEVVPLLERLYEHEDPNFRKLVLDLASRVPGDKVSAFLLRALADRDPNVRMTAAEYLRDRGDREAVLLFEELVLREEEPMVQAVLFEALADTGCGGRSEEIIDHFRDSLDSILIRPFLKFVGACGEPQDASWIQEDLLSGRIPFSREAVDALISLKERFSETKLSREFLSFLREKIFQEKHALGVYQLLRLISLESEEEARKLAGELLESGIEPQAEGARDFLGLEDQAAEEEA